jgi:hypothetical protein
MNIKMNNNMNTIKAMIMNNNINMNRKKNMNMNRDLYYTNFSPISD